MRARRGKGDRENLQRLEGLLAANDSKPRLGCGLRVEPEGRQESGRKSQADIDDYIKANRQLRAEKPHLDDCTLLD